MTPAKPIPHFSSFSGSPLKWFNHTQQAINVAPGTQKVTLRSSRAGNSGSEEKQPPWGKKGERLARWKPRRHQQAHQQRHGLAAGAPAPRQAELLQRVHGLPMGRAGEIREAVGRTWVPGRWKHGLKPAVAWCFNFDPGLHNLWRAILGMNIHLPAIVWAKKVIKTAEMGNIGIPVGRGGYWRDKVSWGFPDPVSGGWLGANIARLEHRSVGRLERGGLVVTEGSSICPLQEPAKPPIQTTH